MLDSFSFFLFEGTIGFEIIVNLSDFQNSFLNKWINISLAFEIINLRKEGRGYSVCIFDDSKEESSNVIDRFSDEI